MSRRSFLALFLVVLSAGYLAAMANLYLTHHRVDGRNALTPRDLVLHFHGSEGISRLQMMIDGPMGGFLESDDEKTVLEIWISDGALREDYPEIEDILDQRCTRCHDEYGKASFSPLASYEDVIRHTRPDTGISWHRLARLSHQHLFGMGFIFFCLGILSMKLGQVSRLQWICLTGGLMFVLLDIGGWWITRMHPGGAWLVILSGAGHALCFLCVVVIALIRLWSDQTASD